MEQNELIPNQLMHPRGCDTKRMLEKKGLKEPKFELFKVINLILNFKFKSIIFFDIFD